MQGLAKATYFVFVYFCSMQTVFAEVMFDGQSSIRIQESIGNELKQHEINKALALGVKGYISEKEPALFKFFDQHVTLEKLQKKIPELVSEFKVISQHAENGLLKTSVRGVLNINLLKQSLSKFGAVNRVASEERSQLAFVFVARQQNLEKDSFEKIAVNNEVEIPIKDVFQQGGYRVMSGYQFQKLTGNVFNKKVLEMGYVSSGQVDWHKAELAAMMSSDATVGLYMVVGTFDVEILGEDDLTGMWQVKVTAKGDVVDVYQYQSIVSINAAHRSLGVSVYDAINTALKISGKKMAEKMVNTLYSQNIY
jgi:hypothetical protein